MGGRHGTIAESTAEGYEYSALHVKRHFGDKAVGEVTPGDLVAWKRAMSERRADGKCLGNTTRRKAFTLLKRAYASALRAGAIERTPFAAVDGIPASAGRRNSLDERSYARLRMLLEEADHSSFNTAVRLALRTGMRRGEICGLRWKDVDLETGDICVCNVITVYRGGARSTEKQPKGYQYRDNTRTIPGTPGLAELFARRKAFVVDALEGWDMGFDEGMYVVSDLPGRHLNPTLLTKQWAAYANAVQLTGVTGGRCTFHDLRHTFATRALAEGIDVLVVARILGHSDPSLTLNVYADALRTSKTAAMLQLDKLF